MPPSNTGSKPFKPGHGEMELAESRRQRLQRGIAALQVALDCLPLTGQQRVLVQSLIRDQEKILALVSSTPQASPKSKNTVKSKAAKQVVKLPCAKQSKTPLTPEEHARRTLEGQLKKQQQIERDKRVRMIEAQRRAEIEATHRKSGYTTFQLRAPGSFGGGKK